MSGPGDELNPHHRRRLRAAAAGRPVSSFSLAFLLASALAAAIALASLMFGWPLTASAGQNGSTADALECPGGFVVDFAGLPAGTILGEQYASLGLHISAVANGGDEFPDKAIVFDSNSTDPNLDADLRVGVGNIAILAKNLNDSTGDGLVDRPDENDAGGSQIYAFDEPVSIGSFLFIDKDHGTPDKAIVYDAAGNVIKQVAIPLAGNGSVQTIVVDADGVSHFEIVYRDSGGLTGIEVCPPEATPTPPPTTSPTPTAGPTAAPTQAPAASPSPSPSPAIASQVSPPAPVAPTPAALAGTFPTSGGAPGAGSSSALIALLGVALALCALAICDLARRRWKRSV